MFHSLTWENISIELLSLNGISIDKANLSEEEISRLENIKSTSRKNEFYGTRILKVKHLPDHIIEYSEHGKPFLSPRDTSFSISHSSAFASIVYSRDKRNIAIDVEKVAPRVLKVKDKFINDNEFAFIPNEDEVVYATILWSAKEVMFKILENGSVDFKNHYTISPFKLDKSGDLIGKYSYNTSKEITLKYWQLDDSIIVVGYENQSA